jgi:hypothetical protein
MLDDGGDHAEKEEKLKNNGRLRTCGYNPGSKRYL